MEEKPGQPQPQHHHSHHHPHHHPQQQQQQQQQPPHHHHHYYFYNHSHNHHHHHHHQQPHQYLQHGAEGSPKAQPKALKHEQKHTLQQHQETPKKKTEMESVWNLQKQDPKRIITYNEAMDSPDQ
uniref:Nuclear FMR1 interacting protein 2 n=1 Tax=Canis lupus familiaris TaxID=9615 RepID=A0A8I3NGS5_CANLF